MIWKRVKETSTAQDKMNIETVLLETALSAFTLHTEWQGCYWGFREPLSLFQVLDKQLEDFLGKKLQHLSTGTLPIS